MGLISRVSSRTYRISSFQKNLKTTKTPSRRSPKTKPRRIGRPNHHFQKRTRQLASCQSHQRCNKVNKIKVVRKNIAKTLTVLNQSQKAELQKFYRGKSFKPTDLKPRKTRALRRRLNKAEEGAKKLKQIRREQKTAVKKFALKA